MTEPSSARQVATTPTGLRVCVYCGSREGADPVYRQAAEALGKAIGQGRAELVYGGARVGLMGVLADAALASGARVTGVIPQRLMAREVGHTGLHQLQVVPDMHTRKRCMAEASDVFMALPGGIGTMEEFFEVWTWRQLGYHDQPVGLLNVAGYYDPLLELLDRMVGQGFLDTQERALPIVDADPTRLLERLRLRSLSASADDDFSQI